MVTLTTNVATRPEHLVVEKSLNSSSAQLEELMSSRHVCHCCSYTLLRHIHLGKIYWRCQHCYQAMPLMEVTRRRIPSLMDYEPSLQEFLLSESRRDPLLKSMNASLSLQKISVKSP